MNETRSEIKSGADFISAPLLRLLRQCWWLRLALKATAYHHSDAAGIDARDFADKVLALGLTISISGIVTFKNAKDLQETARIIPADRLLIETDSPFLAPVPHRGRPCEPAFVADTARFLALLRGEPVEQLAETTTANYYRLFTKARQS